MGSEYRWRMKTISQEDFNMETVQIRKFWCGVACLEIYMVWTMVFKHLLASELYFKLLLITTLTYYELKFMNVDKVSLTASSQSTRGRHIVVIEAGQVVDGNLA